MVNYLINYLTNLIATAGISWRKRI